MKKKWKKPNLFTMYTSDLEKHIKVAAWSRCEFAVFR